MYTKGKCCNLISCAVVPQLISTVEVAHVLATFSSFSDVSEENDYFEIFLEH